jgi:hypothetical protein
MNWCPSWIVSNRIRSASQRIYDATRLATVTFNSIHSRRTIGDFIDSFLLSKLRATRQHSQ